MSKPVIVCVDDEKIILSSLKSQLQHRFGTEYRIELAESAEEALELLDELHLRAVSIPLVIADHIMPGMYGDKFLQAVKEKLPDTFSIMLTGQATADAVGYAVNKAGLYRYIAKPWQEDDFLMTVETALDSYCKNKALRRKEQHQQTLSRIIHLVLSGHTLDAQLHQALKLVLELDEFSGTALGALYLSDDTRETLRCIITQDNEQHRFPASIDRTRFDAGTQSLFNPPNHFQTLNERREYELPIRFQQKLLGALLILPPYRHRSCAQLSALLTAISDTLAGMIQLAQFNDTLQRYNHELEQTVAKRTEALNQALRKQEQLNDILLDANKQLDIHATTDFLTKLHNRRHFFECANQEVARAQRYQHPTALMMLDVDHFKEINDAHGHHAGDVVLKLIAEILSHLTRQHDIVGRIGGEEFSILMPESTLQNCLDLAERIRHSIAETVIALDSKNIHISISIGVTELFPQEKSIEKALGRADQALYESKCNGRNLVSTHPGD